MPPRRKPALAVRAFWYVALALAVSAFLFQLLRKSVGTMAVGQVARAYVALVKQGKLDAAYAMLSPATQHSVPRGHFEDALGSREIYAAGSISFKSRPDRHDATHACLGGALSIGSTKQLMDVFLHNESGAWRVVAVRVYGGAPPPGPWPCGGH